MSAVPFVPVAHTDLVAVHSVMYVTLVNSAALVVPPALLLAPLEHTTPLQAQVNPVHLVLLAHILPTIVIPPVRTVLQVHTVPLVVAPSAQIVLLGPIIPLVAAQVVAPA